MTSIEGDSEDEELKKEPINNNNNVSDFFFYLGLSIFIHALHLIAWEGLPFIRYRIIYIYL